jgi:hypothetical protein
MQENKFNLAESIYEVLKIMDDKRAGKLIKAVGEYNFNNKIYSGNDTIIKTNFILIKRMIDAKRNGKKCCGGDCNGCRSSKKYRNFDKPNAYYKSIVVDDDNVDEYVKSLFSAIFGDEKPEKD